MKDRMKHLYQELQVKDPKLLHCFESSQEIQAGDAKHPPPSQEVQALQQALLLREKILRYQGL